MELAYFVADVAFLLFLLGLPRNFQTPLVVLQGLGCVLVVAVCPVRQLQVNPNESV